MASSGINRSLKSYDSIFQNDEQRNSEEIKPVPISELKPFEQQPFKVLLDESMDELVDSIKQSGVLTPVIARPHKDGGYEILSGHRRVKACELAGITDIPVVVKNLDDDTATILLVDSNLQRENILPSEKAYAYKLKLEALKRQGQRTDLTSRQFGEKLSVEKVSENNPDSARSIHRYIRLTELIDPLLDMVDQKKLPLNSAVELSYLGTKAQSDVVKSIEKHEIMPSIEQSSKIRKLSKDGKVSESLIDNIIRKQKPEKIRIVFKEDRLRKYFPESFTPKQIEDTIIKLIEKWARKRNEPER